MPEERTDDLDALCAVLPPRIRAALDALEHRHDVLEFVMDLGRLPEARFPEREVVLSTSAVTAEDLAYVVEHISPFGGDNRAGIERTLHRISAMRNRRGEVVGLTCRVGRAVRGTVALIRDVIEAGNSILILGRPGVGKTTLLREAARVLADELGQRVVVVDTSNEIAGDGDIPHPGIGRARRMQVARPAEQHQVMIEAVENHMPEVIIIDEIGTELEAQAARTIAERGVQLVGTAHGRTLDNLLMNPTLSDLVGGTQTVTLGDEEARRRGTQKTVIERKAPPTFDVLVEQQSWREAIVHKDVALAVDTLLRGRTPLGELRVRDDHDRVRVEQAVTPIVDAPAFGGRRPGTTVADPWEAFTQGLPWEESEPEPEYDVLIEEPTGTAGPAASSASHTRQGKVRIYPFGISRDRLEEASRHLRLPLEISNDQHQADAVITSRTFHKRHSGQLGGAQAERKPVYVSKTNTVSQIEQCLARVFDVRRGGVRRAGSSGVRRGNPAAEAIQEAEDAIHRLLNHNLMSADLAPQNAYVRRLQHQVVERYNLQSTSYGKDPNRRVKIFAR